jgi:hypothetical protein
MGNLFDARGDEVTFVNSMDVGWLVLEPFIDSVYSYRLYSEFCKHFEL